MPSYNRARTFPRNNARNDLASLFGALGGSEIEPEVDDSLGAPFETGRFKPSRPVLNVLSGGKGSELANQANLEQYLNAQEYQRKLSAAKEASKLQISGAKELEDYEIGNLPRRLAIGNIFGKQAQESSSEIAQNQLARELFIKSTGHLPDERPDQFAEWLKSDELYSLFKKQTEEQMTESQRKTAINKYGQQLDASVFPHELQSKTNTARAGIPKSLEEEYRANQSMELAPLDVGLKRTQLEGAIEDEPITRQLGLARQANIAHGEKGGIFNLLTGKDTPIGGGGLELDSDGNIKSPSVSPYGKEGGVYDPLFNERRYPKQQQKQPDTGTSPINPKGTSQSPSSGFAPLPVTGLGGSPAKDEALRIAVQNLINSKGVQGNIGIPSNLNILSTQELRDLYNKLSE